nr:hypothetical protein CFP56_11277 [Quercus suber]
MYALNAYLLRSDTTAGPLNSEQDFSTVTRNHVRHSRPIRARLCCLSSQSSAYFLISTFVSPPLADALVVAPAIVVASCDLSCAVVGAKNADAEDARYANHSQA